MDVINMKLGSEQASAAPAKARRTPRVVKLLAADCSMRKKPQRKILAAQSASPCFEHPHISYLNPRYLPRGSLCINRLVGRDQARNPK